MNYYAYCTGNPLRYIDPSGNSWLDIVSGSLAGTVETMTGGASRKFVDKRMPVENKVDYIKGKMVGNYIMGKAADAGIGGGTGLTASVIGAPEGVVLVSAKVSATGNLIANAANLVMLSEGSPSSVNKLQREIEKNQAPKGLERADKGRGPYEKDHIHFKKNNAALNNDGTWKHGFTKVSSKVKSWLRKHKWKEPTEND